MSAESTKILWLLPVPLSEEGISHIPEGAKAALSSLRFIIVERARTARRWIKKIQPDVSIEMLQMYELNKHGDNQGLVAFMEQAIREGDIGLMSEAGCPGIADPGAEVVGLAHRMRMQVRPMTGPSSIFLALMASGFSGQQFAFVGYLPPKRQELKAALKRLEQRAKGDQAAQIFIETPYRNDQIFEVCLEVLHPATQLCIAKNITGADEWIYSTSIEKWGKTTPPPLHKSPCIFIISTGIQNQNS